MAGKIDKKPISVLVVDDDPGMLEFLEIMLKSKGFQVCAVNSGEKAIKEINSKNFDIIIADIRMKPVDGLSVLKEAKKVDPSVIVIMISAYASTETALTAMKEGAYDYLPKPFKIDEMYKVLDEAIHKRRVHPNDTVDQTDKKGELHFGLFIGESPAMYRVYDLIKRVSKVDSNVLITGESGTGKELVARAIHKLSTRSNGPFVAVNCGGVPESLIESELFGYKKGAFTGASNDKMGLVEAAQKGTLFLDEIGDLTPSLQVKLLRLLQEKTVRRIGDTKDIPVDVRIIAATNRDIEKMVVEGTFREDLFYRLNVIPIHLPPLRERREDIPLLAQFFLKKYSKILGKDIQRISSFAMDILKNYDFPGNVRELENIIERGVALEQTAIILPESLTISSGLMKQKYKKNGIENGFFKEIPPEGLDLDALLEKIEKHYLLQALHKSHGSKQKAANLLKMSFRSFRYRLSKYNITLEDDETTTSLITHK